MALFDGEEIHEDLHLMVAENPDGSHVVVYGEVYVKVYLSAFLLKFVIILVATTIVDIEVTPFSSHTDGL